MGQKFIFEIGYDVRVGTPVHIGGSKIIKQLLKKTVKLRKFELGQKYALLSQLVPYLSNSKVYRSVIIIDHIWIVTDHSAASDLWTPHLWTKLDLWIDFVSLKINKSGSSRTSGEIC